MTAIASPPKAHGIPFKAPMVRALLNTKPGVWPAEAIDKSLPAKWQTRRIIKQDKYPNVRWGEVHHWHCDGGKYYREFGSDKGPIPLNRNGGIATKAFHRHYIVTPHPPGTILWAKEAWGPAWMDNRELAEAMENGEGETFFYRADWPDENVQPSLGGSGWRSSMLMPRIASRIDLLSKSVRVERAQDISETDAIAEGFTGRDGFAALWLEINGEKSWDENPFVFVYTIPRTK